MAYLITIRTVVLIMLITFHIQMPIDAIVPQLSTSCLTAEEERHHAQQRVKNVESAIHGSATLGD